MNVSKNFRKSEFTCKCGCGLYNMEPAVIEALQSIRDEYGPISILSASRCKEHNAKVGGVDKSTHLRGLAVDIACISPALRMQLIKLGIKYGVRGFGVKPFSLHLDWDNRVPALWLYPPPKQTK
jgi:uncharacterized protein YcbK (DUF882 family)